MTCDVAYLATLTDGVDEVVVALLRHCSLLLTSHGLVSEELMKIKAPISGRVLVVSDFVHEEVQLKYLLDGCYCCTGEGRAQMYDFILARRVIEFNEAKSRAVSALKQ